MPDGFGGGGNPLHGVSQRLPPQNIQAEQALIGSILANNKAYHSVREFLRPEHFVDPINGKIYAVISSFIEDQRLADAVTLKSHFEGSGKLDEVGGTDYLAQLLSAMVGIINAADYGREIQETWLRRELIDLGVNTVNNAFAGGGLTAIEQADFISQQASALLSAGSAKMKATTVQEAAAKALAEGEAAAKGEHTLGVSTGLASLDAGINRARPGNLILIGARPGMGKTACARTIAHNIALGMSTSADGEIVDDQTLGRPVLYIAAEETDVDYGAAALAQLSGVPIDTILSGTWTKNVSQANALVAAQKRFANAQLHIIDMPRPSLRDIAGAARAFKRQHKGLGAIFVDYLQLMSDPEKAESKRLAVGQNAYGLKDLAKELQCPIFLLSQLSRSLESRADKRPILSDLRETGQIEDAGDTIIFVYRDAYYFNETRPKFDPTDSRAAYLQRLAEWNQQYAQIENLAELIVAKCRRGRAPQTVEVFFNGPRVRIEELRR